MLRTDGGDDLLSRATDRHGRPALPWVTAPLAQDRGARVVELIPVTTPGTDASTHTHDVVGLRPTGRGADGAGPAPPTPVLIGPERLPLADAAADAVVLRLILPTLTRPDAMFGELRRVLRPAGTLVLIVATARITSWTELRWRSVTADVHRRWPLRSALDRVEWLLAAADFAVVEQHRIGFTVPLPDGPSADRLVDDLPAAGLWPRRADAGQRARDRDALADRAGSGAVVPVPLRRVVARR